MLTNKEILTIAKKIIINKRLNAKVKLVSYTSFKRVAKKSPLILKVLSEGYPFSELNVPAVYSHKNNTIFICKKILGKLMIHESKKLQIKFIKALMHHEIFHQINQKKLKDQSFNSAMLSEERAERQFKKIYPGLAALAKRISAKRSKF